MIADFLSDITSKVIVKTLDASTLRHKAIANNIANAETPGYKRSQVVFETELARIMSGLSKESINEGVSNLTPVRQTDLFSPSNFNGNNVNIDAELTDLARNAMLFQAATVLLEGKGAMIRAAISEGKK
ncbi:MAG: flagellar basal body rod protein FlgB [Armatimonadota bacterium]